jgi:RND family efflux transporter MFP subunit
MRYSVACCAVLLTLLGGCKKENAYVAPPPPQVGVMHPLSRMFTPSADYTGNAVAYNLIDLVARVPGFVEEIDYKDGSYVEQGTKLFVIEQPPYQAKLQQAQAALATAQANYTYYKAQYERQFALSQGQGQFAAQSAVDQARAQMLTAQSDIQNQTAAVALAGINLGYTTVAAPFHGIVTNHLVSIGALVGETSPTKLATLVQLDPVYVTFNVSEQDVLRIRSELTKGGVKPYELLGTPVDAGLMTEQGYPHAGKLDYIAPEVDSSTGTLMARAVFANPTRALLPGFFVRVRIPLAHFATQALMVPDTALGTDQAGRYVLVVDKSSVVQLRAVQVGALNGSMRVITTGLQPDDEVIVTGLARAVVGEKVAPSPAPPTPS